MAYTILVADGDSKQCKAVADLAKKLGAGCVIASGGYDALAKLVQSESGFFDLAFVDLALPDLDGIGVTRRFRESDHADAMTLPIVGMTTEVAPALFGEAFDAGMNNVARKPMTKDVISAFVTMLVLGKNTNSIFCSEAYLHTKRLREERDRAIEVERTRSFFFSTVSHDIRTPLNAIVGFSQMLSLGIEDPAEEKRAIDSIIVSGKTLLQLVNDILDLSKLEAGKMSIDPEPSDCTHIVNEIVESFRAANPNSAVDIRAKVEKMPVLLVDPQRIRQILFNLVGNAVKFTEKGFVEIRSSFEPTEKGIGTLKLEVEDTGCGIPFEDMNRLASPYMQFNRGAKKCGTGLGLAICRQLINAMSGELELESDVGRGSVFYVTVPNVRVGTAALKAKLPSGPNLKDLSADSARHSALRILLVDDSNVNLMVLKAMLNRLGVTNVVTATNGREAIEILLKSAAESGGGSCGFDMVMTDLWMPEMDGETFLRVIRAQPQLSGIPVYAVTADVESQKTTTAAGFTDVLLKPITIEKLRALIF